MAAKKAKIAIIGAGMAGLTAANRLYTASRDLFDLTVFEAGHRIGGRIMTADFAGDRIEIGATWIHGIGESPVYALATEQNLLEESSCNWERMDGFPSDPLTVAEGGFTVDQDHIAGPIWSLFHSLMDDARTGHATSPDGDPGVGAYLRRRFQQYQATRVASADTGCRDNTWSLENLEEALFAMEECTQRTYSSADDISDLNLSAESEYRDFPGNHITIAKGYSRIVEHLASGLPPGTIHLGQRLRQVEWCSGDGALPDGSPPVRLQFSDETVVHADHVIVTVSLGVLKAENGKESEKGNGIGIYFDPALPDFKREAIGRLGWGVVNKLFMETETETETESRVAFPFLRMAFNQDREDNGSMRYASKIPWWVRKTESICPIYSGSRVLLAWFAGKEATHLESLDDEEIIRGVNATLDAFLPTCGAKYAHSHASCTGTETAVQKPGCRITSVKRSRWATDPLFLGSYSYVSTASSGDDLDLMAEPLPRGKNTVPRLQILFAGEATHRTHYSTTHGAYYSGIREADRLLQFYNVN
ncbi:putative polyamine oxidase 5 [Carex littledalei]|uniref:Putative polyamine oxidase 5 n=1 Tax=Carex littledalei TaxID=544730 RepID=A0A833R206_9POAL|nr:putative polyamine oxidase 5 [Carex littledalei]